MCDQPKTPLPLVVDVTVTTRIPFYRIDDLLCCAFEGGSTHWCKSIGVIGEWPGGATYEHEVLTRGGTLKVYHDDNECVKLTPDKLVPALELMARRYPRWWTDFINENEDSETGDVFFQLMCFGDVVYG